MSNRERKKNRIINKSQYEYYIKSTERFHKSCIYIYLIQHLPMNLHNKNYYHPKNQSHKNIEQQKENKNREIIGAI